MATHAHTLKEEADKTETTPKKGAKEATPTPKERALAVANEHELKTVLDQKKLELLAECTVEELSAELTKRFGAGSWVS